MNRMKELRKLMDEAQEAAKKGSKDSIINSDEMNQMVDLLEKIHKKISEPEEEFLSKKKVAKIASKLMKVLETESVSVGMCAMMNIVVMHSIEAMSKSELQKAIGEIWDHVESKIEDEDEEDDSDE